MKPHESLHSNSHITASVRELSGVEILRMNLTDLYRMETCQMR